MAEPPQLDQSLLWYTYGCFLFMFTMTILAVIDLTSHRMSFPPPLSYSFTALSVLFATLSTITILLTNTSIFNSGNICSFGPLLFLCLYLSGKHSLLGFSVSRAGITMKTLFGMPSEKLCAIIHLFLVKTPSLPFLLFCYTHPPFLAFFVGVAPLVARSPRVFRVSSLPVEAPVAPSLSLSLFLFLFLSLRASPL